MMHWMKIRCDLFHRCWWIDLGVRDFKKSDKLIKVIYCPICDGDI